MLATAECESGWMVRDIIGELAPFECRPTMDSEGRVSALLMAFDKNGDFRALISPVGSPSVGKVLRPPPRVVGSLRRACGMFGEGDEELTWRRPRPGVVGPPSEDMGDELEVDLEPLKSWDVIDS